MAQGLLNYYPSQKYLDKNWAPEQVDMSTLQSMANAQQLAVNQGLLSPYLAQRMLPTALVEGWEGGFGVMGGKYGYPATPQRDKMLQNLGLKIGYGDGDGTPDADVLGDIKSGYQATEKARGNANVMAKLAVAVMAEKARLYGENKAIERWNGRGTAMEDTGYDVVKANARNHAAKVEEMLRMLNDPHNAQIMQTYQGLLGNR